MANRQERREKGLGNIYQSGNKWIGRLDITSRAGPRPGGKRRFKYFSGKTEAEVKKKIREYLKTNETTNATKVSVSDYADKWLVTYKKPELKRSSYDRLEKTIMHQVKPYIGSISLSELTADDIQTMLNTLQKEGLSWSSIKKAHDAVHGMIQHALDSDDLTKDPTGAVKMPSKDQFTQKEIRYFTKDEARAIVEELGRQHKTGQAVYPYAEAYILILNTGLREGELIGLEKADWDKESNTIHVRRNVQSVKKRDDDGKANGYELVTNTTKTYSGDRIIHLNTSAQAAVESMVTKYPNSKYLMCNSKGDIIPPANLIRSFYRVLDNVGIERTGPHSLRHTFASFLFAEKIDVKTISKILGHSNTQITINTYIHLIQETEKEAVDKIIDLI